MTAMDAMAVTQVVGAVVGPVGGLLGVLTFFQHQKDRRRRRALPDPELRDLLHEMKHDARTVVNEPTPPAFFLELERQQRGERLQQWPERLRDKELRQHVQRSYELWNVTQAGAHTPQVFNQRPMLAITQSDHARDCESELGKALKRLNVLDRRTA